MEATGSQLLLLETEGDGPAVVVQRAEKNRIMSELQARSFRTVPMNSAGREQ